MSEGESSRHLATRHRHCDGYDDTIGESESLSDIVEVEESIMTFLKM